LSHFKLELTLEPVSLSFRLLELVEDSKNNFSLGLLDKENGSREAPESGDRWVMTTGSRSGLGDQRILGAETSDDPGIN